MALTANARKQMAELEANGFGKLPICMAKTQYSFSDDMTKLGAPEDFTVTVRNVKVSAGAGFTEHVVSLPKSLFGQKRVYVRVVPVAKNMATLGYDYSENGALRYNSMVESVVNFGSFVVRYN